MQGQHFWSQDIRVLMRRWIAGILTLSQVLIIFGMLSLTVVIPGLLMWWFQVATGHP